MLGHPAYLFLAPPPAAPTLAAPAAPGGEGGHPEVPRWDVLLLLPPLVLPMAVDLSREDIIALR